jgi:hypothetical protein
MSPAREWIPMRVPSPRKESTASNPDVRAEDDSQ